MSTEKLHAQLPSLRTDGHNEVAVRDRGRWVHDDAGLLDRVGASLNLGTSAPTRYLDIDSVPTPWARPVLLSTVLSDENHVLHQQLRSQWRGLLALVALKEVRGFSQLDVIRVDLQDADGEQPVFRQALRTLAPSTRIWSDTGWVQAYVFRWNKKPIGVTSPLTLVCPAANYVDRISGVAWWDGRSLVDPIPALNMSEKAALRGWLDELITHVGTHAGCVDQNRRGVLLRQLQKFGNDLQCEADTTTEMVHGLLNLKDGAFQYVDSFVRARQRPSAVRLRRTRNLGGPTWLMIDPQIATQWNVPPQDVGVYGATHLGQHVFSGVVDPRSFAGVAVPENLVFRSPADVFTNVLFLLEGANTLPGGLSPREGGQLMFNGQSVTPLLPLNPELLKHFSASELFERTELRPTGDGVKVSVRLPLDGTDNNGREYLVQHEYKSTNRDIVKRAGVPYIGIWPNLRYRAAAPVTETVEAMGDSATPSPRSWKLYFTYYNSFGIADAFDAKAFGTSTTDSHVREVKGPRDVESRTQALGSYPEAFICEANVPSEGLLRRENVGIIGVSQPETLTGSKRWVVGIDFGTTGTHVYATVGAGNPAPVIFSNHVQSITDVSDAQRTIVYDAFVPDDFEPPPLLSVFHELNPNLGAVARPIVDGRIYFLRDYRQFGESTGSLVADLKWGDSRARIRTAAFLRQLLLQVAAEAVRQGANTLEIRFAHPAAFSDDDLDAFNNIWNTMATDWLAKTGLHVIVGESKTESIAAATFFARHDDARIRAGIERGAMCVDIGGGTTDVTCWKGVDNRLIFQSSVRFAGRDILMQPLQVYPDVLSAFDIDVSRLRMESNNSSLFCARADSILADAGDQIIGALPTAAGDEAVKRFVDVIALGVGGLIYYLGLMLKAHRQNGRWDGGVPTLCLGGNGSKLLHWLAMGRFSEGTSAKRYVESMFLSGLGSGESTTIILSPTPKAEVAYGLVQPSGNFTVVDDEPGGAVSGIGWRVGTEHREWNALVRPVDVAAGVELPAELIEFSEFVGEWSAWLAKQGRVPLGDEALLGRARDLAAQELATLRNSSVNAIRIVPPFLIVLRWYIQLQASVLAETV